MSTNRILDYKAHLKLREPKELRHAKMDIEATSLININPGYPDRIHKGQVCKKTWSCDLKLLTSSVDIESQLTALMRAIGSFGLMIEPLVVMISAQLLADNLIVNRLTNVHAPCEKNSNQV